MKIRFTSFEWDSGNIEKCQKHGLSVGLIESFFRRKYLYIMPDVKHSGKEQRFIAVGRMIDGRPVFVAFAYRKNSIRPISARYMHNKEIKKYEEEFEN